MFAKHQSVGGFLPEVVFDPADKLRLVEKGQFTVG
jgi:hypothetical protein